MSRALRCTTATTIRPITAAMIADLVFVSNSSPADGTSRTASTARCRPGR